MKKVINTKSAMISLIVCFGLVGGVFAVQAKAFPLTVSKPIIEPNQSIINDNPRPAVFPFDFKDSDLLSNHKDRDPKDCWDLNDHLHNYINMDTQICPGTYEYTGSNLMAFIYIMADDITLDCNGATIYSDNTSNNEIGGYGIVIDNEYGPTGFDNVTIKNCTINNFYVGLFAYNNYTSGVWGPLNNLTIKNINFDQASQYYSSFRNVNNSTISGITKPQGSENRGMHVLLIRNGSDNNEIYSNTLYANSGIRIMEESNNNKVFNNSFGHMTSADNHHVAMNIDRGSEYNEVYDNNFTDIPGATGKSGVAIGLYGHDLGDPAYGAAYFNEIHHNTITDVDIALHMNHETANNSFYENDFDNIHEDAIRMEPHNIGTTWYYPNNNIFSNNLIANASMRGVYIINSGINNNKFLLNSFIDNTTQAFDNGTNNIYDQDGKGNRWNDFDEPGEGCDDMDSNGVCDAAYTNIFGTGGSIDNYPTTGQITIQPIAPITKNEKDWVILYIMATDPEGDELTYSVDDPRLGSMEGCWPGKDYAFGWKTNAWSSGDYTFTVTASDGEYETSREVQVHINDTCRYNKWGVMVCSNMPANITCY
ncbi:hypothetical protein KKF61_03480 [Patescibacteria group bacterium]|nr:hypothetical protein [Patescibacteria group bacterium]MBU0963849.1 hypothetical protein [Patescibacteria group bacterium]